MAPVSVIILTHNEEVNLPYALASVAGWADDVHVLDSYSSDATVEIARRHGASVDSHRFESYAEQRNWAMEHLALSHGWVLFLDADEQLTPDTRNEIQGLVTAPPGGPEGYYLPFDYYFLGRPLKKAMHPHLRLVKRHARWKSEGPWREFSTLTSNCPVLKNRLIHDCHRGLNFYVSKLVRNARGDAERLYAERHTGDKATPAVESRDGESKLRDRELKLRHRVWGALEGWLPPVLRAFAFFLYNLAARIEPRAGLPGVFFLFLYGLWYPMLVDANYYDIRRRHATGGEAPFERAGASAAATVRGLTGQQGAGAVQPETACKRAA